LTRFCCHFLLNETTRFVQNGVVSYNVHKKNKEKAPNGAVLNGTVAFLLPLDAPGRGRKRLFFLALPVPSFSETTKKRGCTSWVVLWGGCTMVTSTSLPSVLPINIEGGSTKREDKKGRGERTERKEGRMV